MHAYMGAWKQGSFHSRGAPWGGELRDTFWSQKKLGPEKFLLKQQTTVTFDVADVKIGVDMKFEKGLNRGDRDTFPALIMTPSHHFLEN